MKFGLDISSVNIKRRCRGSGGTARGFPGSILSSLMQIDRRKIRGGRDYRCWAGGTGLLANKMVTAATAQKAASVWNEFTYVPVLS